MPADLTPTSARTAPRLVHRAWGWMRENLFSNPLNAALSLLCAGILYTVFVPLFDWLIIEAQWHGSTPADCPDRSAACWPFIRANFNQFMYGLYPRAEQWRVDLGVLLCVLVTAPLFLKKFRHRGWLIPVAIFVYAAVGFVLLPGGRFGLATVETSQWGGFLLTLVTAVFVLSTSLPVAVLLALGRESHLPLVRTAAAIWIEFWRSVPALVVLFVAIIMFPLFMPEGVEIDKLLRALSALTILMATYMAESIRGALQAIPKGQYEAATALGLGYWRRTFLVTLPQAVPAALPQITSNFIGLFKETTILLIVGLYDLLGMVQNAASHPDWLGAGVSATGYLFVAMFFWACCFGLSRYSARLERKASAHRRG